MLLFALHSTLRFIPLCDSFLFSLHCTFCYFVLCAALRFALHSFFALPLCIALCAASHSALRCIAFRFALHRIPLCVVFHIAWYSTLRCIALHSIPLSLLSVLHSVSRCIPFCAAFRFALHCVLLCIPLRMAFRSALHSASHDIPLHFASHLSLCRMIYLSNKTISHGIVKTFILIVICFLFTTFTALRRLHFRDLRLRSLSEKATTTTRKQAKESDCDQIERHEGVESVR
jgi:hypothetical protein